MAEPCVVDTMVLRKANAPLTKGPKEGRCFVKRLVLLKRVRAGELQVLISAKLIREYREQVQMPRNEFVQEFMSVILAAATDPGSATVRFNWPPWPGGRKAEQNHCRFPGEDTHVLRTAYCDGDRSTLFTEEARMLQTDACIYQHFGVHITDPTAL